MNQTDMKPFVLVVVFLPTSEFSKIQFLFKNHMCTTLPHENVKDWQELVD